MHIKISPQTKRELLQALGERYQKASRFEKTRILHEYVAVAECHRKHAIRLLTAIDLVGPEPPTKGRRIYSEAVRQAPRRSSLCRVAIAWGPYPKRGESERDS